MIVGIGQTNQSPRAFHHAKDDLLEQTGGHEVAWFGRGATALYYAYHIARILGEPTERPEVILPSIACPSLASTAHMAGLTPRFADVHRETGMLSLEATKSRHTIDTRALVFIHLYGCTDDLTPLAEWCRRRKIFLIEDNAQALGASLPDGRAVGSVGDVGIYSFNRTKILECGGGALLARTRAAAEALQDALQLHPLPDPVGDDESAELARSYRNLQLAFQNLLRQSRAEGLADLFMRIRPAYDKLYLKPFNPASELPPAWQSLPAVLERRRRKAHLYERELAQGPWRILKGWDNSGVCWRYSLLLDNPDLSVPISESVRNDGFHVSNLFWALHTLFRPEDACPAAEDFASRILNLWVDDSVDEGTVNRCALSLRSHTGKVDCLPIRSCRCRPGVKQ